MIKIGMIIADRYEILGKVGNGGMADVYKAKDRTLGREVAVKILKQEFSENETFVSKFRVEAQAAAGLIHPNIVNVYDVGEDDGIYYIVMELVNGFTLKKYILRKGRLSVRESVNIAIQVAMGLEAAHSNHIIHRDIKPQNIMISREGKVKVTDFGIAKAATSNTITSNVMGSVHYTSPEQARGGFSDEKSDVYSLGVTMYEMLTGHVPFDGETTVAIAIRHIQEEMPSPREEVPQIPYSVEQIVLKCCEKSPDRRYAGMTDLLADLKRSLQEPEGNFVKRAGAVDLSQTRPLSETELREIQGLAKQKNVDIAEAAIGAAAGASALKAEAAAPAASAAGKGPAGRASEEAQSGANSSGSRDNAGASGAGAAAAAEHRGGRDSLHYGEDGAAADPEDERRIENLARFLTVLAGVAIGIIVMVIAASRMGMLSGREQNEQQTAVEATVVMPHVVGETREKASDSLTALGLIPEIVYGESEDFEPGTVISSDIEEGTQVAVGSTVILTVCGNNGIRVPDVVGMTEDEARQRLEDLDFQVRVKESYSEEVEEGCVISQDPAATSSVDRKSTVTLEVSKGPDLTGKVAMPSLLGMSEGDARSMLASLKLKLGTVEVNRNVSSSDIGKVIGQSAEEGEYVEEGSFIDIEVGGQMTYSYSADIPAPTAEEDPDYKAGTSVHLQIVGEDGQVLLSTTTSEMPHPVGFIGVKYDTATLTMTYDVQIEETVVVDPAEDEGGTEGGEGTEGTEGGESGQAEPHTETTVRTETHKVTRILQFTPEG